MAPDAGRDQTADLWTALEEAETPTAWPDSTSQDFRAGYCAALRLALAIVTESSVPSKRPTDDARSQS